MHVPVVKLKCSDELFNFHPILTVIYRFDLVEVQR